jgi:hypothetical protein
LAKAIGEKADVYVATTEASGDEMREWVFQLVRERLDERSAYGRGWDSNPRESHDYNGFRDRISARNSRA